MTEYLCIRHTTLPGRVGTMVSFYGENERGYVYDLGTGTVLKWDGYNLVDCLEFATEFNLFRSIPIQNYPGLYSRLGNNLVDNMVRTIITYRLEHGG
jgi:hypothetical protein